MAQGHAVGVYALDRPGRAISLWLICIVRSSVFARTGWCLIDGTHVDAGKAGFGIEQELARGDHSLSCSQPGKDFGPSVRFAADTDFGGPIAAAFLRDHHQGPLAGANDSFRRDQQRFAPFRREHHLGKHARLEPQARIGHRCPHGDRAARILRARQNGDDASGKPFAGKGSERGAHRLPDTRVASQCLGYRRLEPDRTVPADLGQRLARRHGHARPYPERRDRARLRCSDGDDRLRPSASGDRGDHRVRHAKQPQALASGPGQRFVAGCGNSKILVLCAAPFGHQNVDDRSASGNQVLRCMAVGPLNIAAGARLNDRHLAAVISERAGDADFGLQHAIFRFSSPDPEILDERRIDAHTPGALRVAARTFGNKLHVHERRFARLVEALIRDHRIVPVEHVLAARIGRCIAAAALAAERGQTIARQQTDQSNAKPSRIHALARCESFERGVHGLLSP